MSKGDKAALAALAAIAVAAYLARWRWNYTHPGPPEDIAGPATLTRQDRAILAELEDRTCMESCCVNYDEIDALYDLPD